MYGDLKYRAGLRAFRLRQSERAQGRHAARSRRSAPSTASIPSSSRATPAAGITLLFETLTTPSLDEPFTEYGLLAETHRDAGGPLLGDVHAAPEARWHDGKPVTVEDVIWSFETLKEQGRTRSIAPTTRTSSRSSRPASAASSSPSTDGVNRELPLIIGQLPVLPKHYCADARLRADDARAAARQRALQDQVVRARPLDRLRARPGLLGRRSAGQSRPQQLRRRSATSTTATATSRWRRSRPATTTSGRRTPPSAGRPRYDRPDVRRRAGSSRRRSRHQPAPACRASSSTCAAPLFQDPRVRAGAGLRVRLRVDQQEPHLRPVRAHRELLLELRAGRRRACRARAELALLEPYPRPAARGGVHRRTTRRRRPTATGNIRQNLRKALRLLGEAGWAVEGGKSGQCASGQPFRLRDPAERAVVRARSPARSSRTSSGSASRRRSAVVDPAQYQNRMDDFDFDMTVEVWGQSLSPGNEQRDYWGSRRPPTCRAAATPSASRIRSSTHLIDKIIAAPTPRGPGDRDPRARPRAAVGPLRDPALAQPTLPGRLLGQVRPAGDPSAVRRAGCSAGGSTRPRWPRSSSARPQQAGAKARNHRVASAGHARLHRPPAAADHPDPVRDHGDQLRHHPGRARRAGRADDRAADQGTARRRHRRGSAAPRPAISAARAGAPRGRRATRPAATAARAGSIPSSSRSSSACTASTSRCTSASSR